MSSRIGIVVPCYNEEKRLPVEYWLELIRKRSEILWVFVDDGSQDETAVLLERLCVSNSVQVIRLSENLGKGNAILEGYKVVIEQIPAVEHCGFIDSDGAFHNEDIERFLTETLFQKHQYDVLISSRVALSGRKIDRKPHRHYLGRIIATLVTYKWKDAPYDTQSGFKVFRNSQSFRKAISRKFLTKWFSDVELLCRIGMYNGGTIDIWEEPLMQWRDVKNSKIQIKAFPAILWELNVAMREVRRLNSVKREQWI